ncbi:MAG: NAD(P)/FAD-dependent oxidoreductase [Humibacter sp.]
MTECARVVIVGASIGGLTAAETLRQEGFDGELILLGDEPHLPYSRPPLSKQILLGEWEPEQAALRGARELAELGIELRTSCTALGLDVAGRTLHTTRGDIPFDEVIIATGAEPRRDPKLSTALTLRTCDDARAVRDGLRAARRVGIVGPGVLGSEIASAAAKQGVSTLLLGRSGILTFGAVGPLLSPRLEQLHREHGVQLALSAQIVGTAADGASTRIDFADGHAEHVDLLVATIGGSPTTGWLGSSTLEIANGVVCDADGSAAPGVSAVGDVAAWRDPFTGRPARVEHQSNAIEQAIAVAVRIVHGTGASQPVPLFWSEIHDVRIQAYGWFDVSQPLTAIGGEFPSSASVLVSADVADRVRGVVGWNAPPRDFRAARAAMLTSPSFAPVP